jgi:peptidoglycan/LPS O-acetylase OafA/YrhL
MVLDRLRRVTRDGRWIPEIDGLRFVAIMAVLLFHLWGEVQKRSGVVIPIEPRFRWMDHWLANGDRGVGLFFVISGMILAMPYARHFLKQGRPVSLGKYYLRRVTRLEPPYLASIVVVAALAGIWQHGWPPGYWRHVLASALYQHGLIYGEMSPVNMVTWSLEVEIQFYVLAPLFMQVYRIPGKALRRGLLLGAMVALGFAQAPFWQGARFSMSILFYLQYFLGGLLVADLFVLDLDAMPSSIVWDGLGLVALAMLFRLPNGIFWPHAVVPFAICVLMIAAMRSVALRRFFANGWVAVFGGMCYSIYLLHFIWISAIFKVTRRLMLPQASLPVNYAIQLVVTGVPAVLLCVGFYLLVERPCMDPDWPSKAWHRVTGRPGREVAALDAEDPAWAGRGAPTRAAE